MGGLIFMLSLLGDGVGVPREERIFGITSRQAILVGCWWYVSYRFEPKPVRPDNSVARRHLILTNAPPLIFESRPFGGAIRESEAVMYKEARLEFP